MPSTTDNYNDTSLLNETLQSEVSGGTLQTALPNTESRTTSTNFTTKRVKPKRFDYTVAKKPAATNGRVALSQDYDTQRENVYHFDGATEVTIPDSDDFSFGDSGISDSPFSVASWVNIHALPGTVGIVNKYQSSSNQIEWYFAVLSTGKVRLFLYDVVGTLAYVWRDSSIILDMNTWYHLLVTYDGRGGSSAGDGIEIYINGERDVGAVSGAGGGVYTGMSNGISPLRFGYIQFLSSKGWYVDGNIADVSIHNTALTATDAETLYSGGDVSAGLVSRWAIDEGAGTAFSEPISDHTATVVTGGTWTTDTNFAHLVANWKNSEGASIKSGAYDFDGINDYIDIGHDKLEFSNLTYLTKVRVDGASGNGSYGIVGGNQSYNNSGYVLWYYDDNNRFQWRVNGSGVNSNINTPTGGIEIGRWYTVAGVIDGSIIRLYLDGSLYSSSTHTGYVPSSPEKFYFGREVSGNYSNISIGETLIYSEALSDEEIWNYTAYGQYPDDTNLEAHYRFNGNALDETANNKDGTPVNNPTIVQDWTQLPHSGFSMLGEAPRNALLFGTSTYEYLEPVNTLSSSSIDYTFTLKWKPLNSADLGNLMYIQTGYLSPFIQSGTYQLADGAANRNFGVAVEQDVVRTVTYVMDGTNSQAKLFIDGVQVGSITMVARTMGGAVRFLNISAPSTRVVDGEIYEISLYDRTLSDSEVADFYNGNHPTGNRMFYCQLQEGSGTALADTWGINDLQYVNIVGSPSWIYKSIDNSYQTASFDGNDDFVTFDIYDINTDPISLSLWAKPHFNNKQCIAFKLGAGPGPSNDLFDGVQISFWSDAKIYSNFRDTSIINADYPAIYTGYSANEWYHVAQVIDRVGQTNKLYINGVLAATTSITPIAAYNLNSSTRGVTVGCRQVTSGPQALFDGEICNVAVWNDVRTAGEIAQEYERGWVDTNDANIQKYWPLAGDYQDSVGTDHGVNSGSTFVKDLYRPMPEFPITAENLLGFDGTGDYVTFGNDNLGISGTTPFTLGMWLKTEDASANNIVLSKYRGSSPFTGSFEFTQGSGKLNFYLLGGSFTNRINKQSVVDTFPSGVWKYVIFTWDGTLSDSGMNIYMDNNEVTYDTSNNGGSFTGITGDTNNTNLGFRNNSSSYLAGNYSDVAIWNRVLTVYERTQVFTQGSSAVTSGLTHQWDIDEGLGITIDDSVGSSDGTITGATWTTGTRPPIFDGSNGTLNSITLSNFSKATPLHYRHLFDGETDKTFALDDVTMTTGSAFIPHVQIV